MAKEIKKVGVIGAGVMGSGIAGQLANAGIEVVMLDKFEGKAEEAIQRMVKAKPTDPFNAGLMAPENAKHITPGTMDDNIELLADCDWIVESILAPQHIREELYKSLEAVAKSDAIFSSNTSTIQIDTLTEGQSDDFKKRFLNTHFFNPVRFMHLLEIITNEDSDPEIAKAMSEFGSKVLGKKTVHCKDERGFIANRIGMYAMERAKSEAQFKDINIEDIDAIMGTAFGFPRLGMFKLADEVGLHVIDHVRTDLNENLPETDAFKKAYTGDQDLKDLLENNHLGKRQPGSRGGYYRIKLDKNEKPIMGSDKRPRKEVLDLLSGHFRDFQKSRFSNFHKDIKSYGGFDKFFDSNSDAAEIAWPILRDLMIYVLDHAEELAYDLQDIDDAMRAGFNWEKGPFQLLDQFGVQWFKNKLKEEGIEIPELLQTAHGRNFYRTHEGQNQVMNFDGQYSAIKRGAGVLSLEDVKVSSKPLLTHNSASLWDIGDGVVALEFHSIKNAIDPSIFYMINESVKLVSENPDKYKGMVIYNDADSFSFGANLKLVEVFMDASENKALRTIGLGNYLESNLFNLVGELVYQGQAVYNALNQAPFPVIGAPKGNPKNMALGGGAEVLLHCDAIQSGPEQILALPEAGLGILPGWGGSTRYLQRAFEKPNQLNGPMPAVIETTMALANPLLSGATSAQDAKKKLWLSQDDGVSMNPDTVLADAKAKVLEMAEGYEPKPMPSFNLPGLTGKGAIRMNVDKMYQMGGNPKVSGINHIDVRVADALADIVTGGETIHRDDVDLHVKDHAVASKLKRIMDERGEDEIGVHPGITLNISHMLQLERDRFLDRFRDKASWKRVRHTMATNQPLREPRLHKSVTPKTIRDGIIKTKLPRRAVTGEPLTGQDANRLKAMADMTTEFYRLNAQKSPIDKIKQATRTLGAARHVFKMF